MRLIGILVLLAAPLLELGLLIKVGQIIGFWWTMAIIVGTGFLGVAVMMENGFSSPRKMQEAMARGEIPVGPMLDGAFVVLAAVLLLTPGLIADALGLLLLVPPIRRLVARGVGRGVFGTIQVRTAGMRPGRADSDRREARPRGAGPVIEGEYERLGERPVEPRQGKPNGHDRP